MVRFGPDDLDKVPPGIIFALDGLWKGRNKHTQELNKKSKPESKGQKKSAVRK